MFQPRLRYQRREVDSSNLFILNTSNRETRAASVVGLISKNVRVDRASDSSRGSRVSGHQLILWGTRLFPGCNLTNDSESTATIGELPRPLIVSWFLFTLRVHCPSPPPPPSISPLCGLPHIKNRAASEGK